MSYNWKKIKVETL